MAITQAIPALQSSPAATIIAVPAELFDLTGPARNATATVHAAQVRNLIRQIKALDPNYRHRMIGPPIQTFQGQITEINKLRFDRAVALYRVRGDARALQIEVLRFVQARVDAAYEQGLAKYAAGELTPHLSRNEAIGNYVDRVVRADLRERFNAYNIDHSAGPIRVVGRAYDNSITPSSFVVPDAAVTDAAFDWSLQRKTPGMRQLRGFFNSDFRPEWTAIIRPTQLGAGHTYVIKARRR